MSHESDLGWAAGIIDGEGSISLGYNKKKKRYTLIVSIGNTNLPMLEHLHVILGRRGKISQWKFTDPSKHKPFWVLHIASKAAAEALNEIEPYLVGKVQQAQLGLASRRYLAHNRRPNIPTNLESLRWLKERLGELNHRGPIAIEEGVNQ